MTKLSVNLNKIALLRNARALNIPNIVRAAEVCIAAGCHGITVHPRPDERHIRRQDVFDIAKMVSVEYNIEGNPFPDFMALVREVRPTQCTLVPDSPDQNTSDHGWDLPKEGARVAPLVRELKALGIRVSLFLDPVEDDVRRAKDIGADRVEWYTEPYASAFARGDYEGELARYIRAAELAQSIGLEMNAGHDLNLDNLGIFCARVPGILEVSIGHALVADAVFMGLGNAVKAYLGVLGPIARLM